MESMATNRVLSVAPGLRVEEVAGKGRGLVAGEAVGAGCVLLVERAVAWTTVSTASSREEGVEEEEEEYSHGNRVAAEMVYRVVEGGHAEELSELEPRRGKAMEDVLDASPLESDLSRGCAILREMASTR
jgi:hypothetical protein